MAWLRERQKVKRIQHGKINQQLYGEGVELFEGRDEMVNEIDSVAAANIGTDNQSTSFQSNKVNSFHDIKPVKTPRPRTRSDKIERKGKVIVEVSKSSAFEWPLGRLGKLRQKYSRSRSKERPNVPKSASALALTPKDPDRLNQNEEVVLKRHLSERNKTRQPPKVAFEQTTSSLAASWWSASLRFIWGEPKNARGRSRRRHLTDPCKN